MPLAPGTQLGPYEILSLLGAGGMGEVYRARDTRLERTVAIKILPSHLSERPESRQRFEREAKAISALSHPHICALYDVGRHERVDFLVMEYLEGETLAERLMKGPLTTEQLLRCAMEISDALEKAHRQGFVHRDLKPGNIMLTKSGAKLMDFGLAKPAEAALRPTSEMCSGATVSKPLTAEGSIVGTFQYMSPEQLQGKEADARSDIFSFGAVLYEMATGRRAFGGKSQISVVAAILERDPEPISKLQPTAPPALDYVVKTCLAKDPEDRPQTAHDVKLQLKWIAQSSATLAGAGVTRRGLRGRWQALAWQAAVVLGISSAVVLGLLYIKTVPKSTGGGATRFTIPLGKAQELSVDTTLAMELSPDGKRLAYVVAESGIPHLYLRSLNEFDPISVPESEGATFPFFSEDNQWVAFFSQGKVKKESATGGNPVVICDVPSFLGGTWTADDQIILAISGLGLARVSASGGTLEKLSVAGGKQYYPALPRALPGDEWVLFSNFGQNGTEVMALSRTSGEVHLVVNNSRGAYYSDGRLLYYASGTIWAAPFDLKNASVTGPAVAIASYVDDQNFIGQFSASRNGVLAYAPGTEGNPGRSLYWVDRQGTMRKIDLPSQDYIDPSISPDGRQFVIAISRLTEQTLAVYDLDRGVLMQMSAGGSVQASPVWTSDGKELVYDGRTPSDKRGIFRVAANGGSPPRLIRELATNGHVTSISPQNMAIVMLADPVSSTDLWLLSLDDDHDFQAFRRTPAMERQGSFSGDGHWLAYASNESSRSEIYVEPVSGSGGRWQISIDGGEQPRWSRKGREIFYRNGTKMMAVAVETNPKFLAGRPVELFDLRMHRGGAVPGYDVTPDGQMFLMVKSGRPNPTEIRVVIGLP